ncbi:MAG: N,N-dimethylformamidase beta subunit family domain-containing protein [Planctomycetaceae bacterium]
MLIGYVSDEDYVALPGVDFEFESDDGSVAAVSTASGAVHVDLRTGEWRATISKYGYTAKRVTIRVADDNVIQFRLLSDRMYGFMWPKWIRAGETSEYCVHSTKEFRLDLWRYGWEKEFIRSFGWCDEHAPHAMAQILPDGDFTQTGVNWNRTGYDLKYQKHAIQAPKQSGLYFLHAKTRDDEFCSFPWIVSPASPRAKIAVLSSTITQNAYNKFGGRSNYFNQDALPGRPLVNARQEVGRYTQPESWPFEQTAAPLSFQRPEPASHVPEATRIQDSIPGRVESLFAPGEWRLLGWLEREGFDYDLYSETELHFGRLPLESYDVLVLNLHPEYWSRDMYARVKRWVHEQGGTLLYLGGCGLYAEVEFDDEAAILCRREGEHSQRGESEAALLGVAYTHSGFQTAAPYRVINAAHWVFEGTGFNEGDLFGTQSLHERCPGGASAHELDKICDESPRNIVRLARGTNPDDSGADLTIYETPSGGSVFSAGSLCWTLSLPVDDGTSAVTRNVLNRSLERGR